LILGVIALGIAVESGLRLLTPVSVDFGDATLVAVLGLLVNLASAALLSNGHHHDHGHEHADPDGSHGHDHHDHNLRAAYVHVLADALTSVLAIIALLSGRYLGWVWLDPVMGIVGALVISRWSWSLMKQTAAVLLDTADERIATAIRKTVEDGGDAHVVDLHVWRVGPGANAAIVSVTGNVSRPALEHRLEHLGVSHLTLEVLR
jgi:cation diffusion facilitator family transporter